MRSNANARRGFTLVEVLAALVFMAILIPVTLQAVRVASRAGQVAERKGAATRIAERVLNELLVTDGLRQNRGSGQIQERHRVYEWTMKSDPWTEDAMNLVTVTVSYEVQGTKYDVRLASLFDSTQLTTSQTQ
jgi:prepilin-type N-terminal cleavage/methylation domain-containing protein